MKALVATSKTQGLRENDFNFVPDGEMVTFGTECSSHEQQDPDASCGCRRALSGMISMRGTTTFEVVDLPLTERSVVEELFRDYLERMGLGRNSPYLYEFLTDWGEDIGLFCKTLPVGTVLERRGDTFEIRVMGPSL